MDHIERQIGRARQRLLAGRLLDTLGWCWTAALPLALAAMAAARFWPLGVADFVWPAAALAAGGLAAVVWTAITVPSPLETAVAIDHRYELKERISSTLILSADDRTSEAGQALVADASHRLERLDVAERFPVRLPRQILWPLVPGALAALLAVLVPPAVPALSEAAATPAEQQTPPPEVKKSTEALRKKLLEQRQLAEKQGLKDATELLKKLEEGTKELQKESRRDTALVKLNDLARQLEAQRRAAGGAEQMKKQLEQLRSLERGPADKFAQALARGDFQQAAEELKKLKEQLGNSRLDRAQKEALGKQLDQMQQKLQQMAQTLQDAQNDLRKRADQARENGNADEANKLDEMLEKLAQQAPNMERMQKLAEQLRACSKCLQEGKEGDADQALSRILDEVERLQRQMEESEALDEAGEQLAQARKRLGCPKCNGEGCAACQGDDDPDGIPGNGLSRGKGVGPRPEQKTDTGFYDSQVRQKVGKGGAAVTDLVPGPNVRGNVAQQIEKESDALRHGSTDPLSGRHMPRKHSEHAREYFDRFREGK